MAIVRLIQATDDDRKLLQNTRNVLHHTQRPQSWYMLQTQCV
jgi:hypothetical protein